MKTIQVNNKLMQSGSVLITVLVVVLLLSMAGVMAVRSSIQNLSQLGIDQVLQAQKDMNEQVYSELINNAIENAGVTGYIGLLDNIAGELVFCYKPTKQSSFFAVDKYGIAEQTIPVQSTSYLKNKVDKACNLRQIGDANSEQNVSFTQVNLRNLRKFNESGYQNQVLPRVDGVEGGGGTLGVTRNRIIRVAITTVTLVGGIDSDVLSDNNAQSCLNNRIADSLDTIGLSTPENITDCLAKFGIPATTHVGEFTLPQ